MQALLLANRLAAVWVGRRALAQQAQLQLVT